jgi:hypothetical protein
VNVYTLASIASPSTPTSPLSPPSLSPPLSETWYLPKQETLLQCRTVERSRFFIIFVRAALYLHLQHSAQIFNLYLYHSHTSQRLGTCPKRKFSCGVERSRFLNAICARSYIPTFSTLRTNNFLSPLSLSPLFQRLGTCPNRKLSYSVEHSRFSNDICARSYIPTPLTFRTNNFFLFLLSSSL